MEQQKTIEIFAEITPNPNTLKFNVNKILLEAGTLDYPDAPKAGESYLAAELFAIPGVMGVFIGRDFITVTKASDGKWDPLVQAVIGKIKTLLVSDRELFPKVAAVTNQGQSDVERRIREILDSEIRPAVAMDGGDIIFHGYRDGVVTLHLQGACSSCPSSILTLKMGVENRLRALVPEIKEVVQM